MYLLTHSIASFDRRKPMMIDFSHITAIQEAEADHTWVFLAGRCSGPILIEDSFPKVAEALARAQNFGEPDEELTEFLRKRATFVPHPAAVAGSEVTESAERE